MTREIKFVGRVVAHDVSPHTLEVKSNVRGFDHFFLPVSNKIDQIRQKTKLKLFFNRVDSEGNFILVKVEINQGKRKGEIIYRNQ